MSAFRGIVLQNSFLAVPPVAAVPAVPVVPAAAVVPVAPAAAAAVAASVPVAAAVPPVPARPPVVASAVAAAARGRGRGGSGAGTAGAFGRPGGRGPVRGRKSKKQRRQEFDSMAAPSMGGVSCPAATDRPSGCPAAPR